ncbi:hypothetical protein VTL71DRAFT_13648 [Oculimacula yallundae]|uniref:Uncharacterized protein n=1 Tax=Oculimacula yallundae TaxID=86028 RepID=A0ABR4CMA9_9HELO
MLQPHLTSFLLLHNHPSRSGSKQQSIFMIGGSPPLDEELRFVFPVLSFPCPLYARTLSAFLSTPIRNSLTHQAVTD